MKLLRRSLRGLRGIDKDSLVNNYGQEWLGLPPDVLQQVLARGIPSVYGGAYGVMLELPPSSPELLGPLSSSGEPLPPLVYPNGEPRLAISGSDPQREFVYDPAIFHWAYNANDNLFVASYQPAYSAKYAGLGDNIQVTRNPYNGSWLSLGTPGGYRDPRLISWDDRYGLITPRANYLLDHDSFWEQWGPMILFTAALAAVAAGGAAGASTAGATETSTVAAEGSVALSDVAVSAEEALREIEMAHLAGATVTQGEAIGWASALESAGLSVPAEISSIASGATPGGTASNGYQSTPSPPSSSPGASSAPSSTSSLPSSGSNSLLTQSGQIVNNPLVKAGAGLVASSMAKPGATSGRTNPAPSAAPDYSYASPDMIVDYTNKQGQTTSQMAYASGQSFNWWWLLAAGAGLYFAKHKMGKGKHHAS